MEGGQVLEEIKCPICFEIPENEIYLCKNGHVICEICLQSVKLCPQCRVSLDKFKIRNRPLEILLDKLQIDCTFKDQGCPQTFGRKDIQSHILNCSFNGKLIQICTSIGLLCTFSINLKNIPIAIDHFVEAHGMSYQKQKSFYLQLTNFNKAVALKSKGKNVTSMWTPVIVDDFIPKESDKNQHNYSIRTATRLLVFITINGTDRSTSCMCVCLANESAEASKYFAEFCIESRTSEVERLCWKTNVVDATKLSIMLPNMPFRIPNNFLLQNYAMEDGSLLVSIKISKENQSQLQQTTSLPPTWILNSALHSPQNLKYDESSAVFDGIKCQDCGICPIKEVRYQRLQAANFNLCKMCIQKTSHTNRWFAVVKAVDKGQLVHSLWVEKQIKWSTSLMGIPLQYSNPKCVVTKGCKNTAMYTCLQCNEHRHYSLCHSCFINQTGDHVFALYMYS